MRTGPELFGVHVKWFGGYYDGAIDGVCEYKGKLCFYDCCEEEDLVEIDWDTGEVENIGYDRIYNVRKAKWWLMIYEFVSHKMFRLLVQKIYTNWSMWLWYDVKKSNFEPHVQCDEIIGWFVQDQAAFITIEDRPRQWRIFRRHH